MAAATAVKQEKLNRATFPPLPNFSSLKGVYFCEVKGVTHNNDDGTSRIAAQQLCSVGDTVRLVPEPSNIHDRNAIRVLLQTGEQIGYISARQAARFKGRVHLLTATVHSRIKDRWGNDTVKLRVSVEQKVYEAATVPSVTAIQAEATETREKEGWQGVLVYFENAGQRLYKVVKAEDAETISRSLQEGMVRVGFIGLTDAPTGIQFTFTLNDSFPTNGIFAKRFLANAREWVVTESRGICARRGDPPPVVGTFQPSEQSTHSPAAMTKPEGWGAGTILLTLLAVMVVGVIVRVLVVANEGSSKPSAESSVSLTDADRLIKDCGPPLKDDSTAYDSPRPPIVTRFVEYKVNGVHLRFIYVPGNGHIGDPPPYDWKLQMVANAKTNKLYNHDQLAKLMWCTAPLPPPRMIAR